MLYLIAKQLRKNAGLTQKQAAELIGITKRSWEMYESGSYSVNMRNLELFAVKTDQDLKKILETESNCNPQFKKFCAVK